MRFKRTILLGIGVGMLAMGGLSYHWWNSTPDEVNPIHPTAQVDQNVLGTETNLQPWQTGLFTTRYPDTLRVMRSDEIKRNAVVGQYLLGATALTQNDQVGVTVGIPESSIAEAIPGVKLRLTDTATYEQTERAYAPAGALIFTKQTHDEVAVFWQANGYYISVVATGSSARQEALESDVEAIVSHWQWQ